MTVLPIGNSGEGCWLLGSGCTGDREHVAKKLKGNCAGVLLQQSLWSSGHGARDMFELTSQGLTSGERPH
jgi:hypothetical protein